MYCIQRKDEFGDDSRLRSNSADEDGCASGAVAVRSTARDLPLPLGLLVSALSASSSESDSDAADGAGDESRPDHSNPPEIFRVGALVACERSLVCDGFAGAVLVLGADMSS